jgi:hypothetical protein
MRRALPLVLAVLLAVVAGCRSTPPDTVAELRDAIAAWRTSGAPADEKRIDALFLRLEAEIAGLEADAAQASEKARPALEEQVRQREADRRDLQQAWLEARMARLGDAAGAAMQGLGESLGRGLEEAGRTMRESMEAGRRPPPAASE